MKFKKGDAFFYPYKQDKNKPSPFETDVFSKTRAFFSAKMFFTFPLVPTISASREATLSFCTFICGKWVALLATHACTRTNNEDVFFCKSFSDFRILLQSIMQSFVRPSACKSSRDVFNGTIYAFLYACSALRFVFVKQLAAPHFFEWPFRVKGLSVNAVFICHLAQWKWETMVISTRGETRREYRKWNEWVGRDRRLPEKKIVGPRNDYDEPSSHKLASEKGQKEKSCLLREKIGRNEAGQSRKVREHFIHWEPRGWKRFEEKVT